MRRSVFGYLIAAFLALTAGPAGAQVWTATINTAPSLGVVIPPATGTTVFRFTPTGAVTTVSGTAIRRTTANVTTLVTLVCAGGNACTSAAGKVRIGATGSGTGKAGLLSNFTIGTVTGASGVSVTATTATYTEFNFTQIIKGTNPTFTFGADFPVSGSDTGTVGAGTSPFYIWPATGSATPSAAGGTNGNATVTTYRPIAFSGTPTMAFGIISKPTSGSAVVTLSTASNTVTVTGNALAAAGTPARASYTLTGEGGLAITVSLPSPKTFVMTKIGDATKTITVNLTNSTLPTALSGAAGSQGTAGFFMGGNFTVTSTTASGDYTGSYSVTAVYN